MPTFLRDPLNPKYNAQSAFVKFMLGLSSGAKLPVDGMPPRMIQGILVQVVPLIPAVAHGRRRRARHRVLARCPSCRRWMSAGRMHQHVCKVEAR